MSGKRTAQALVGRKSVAEVPVQERPVEEQTAFGLSPSLRAWSVITPATPGADVVVRPSSAGRPRLVMRVGISPTFLGSWGSGRSLACERFAAVLVQLPASGLGTRVVSLAEGLVRYDTGYAGCRCSGSSILCMPAPPRDAGWDSPTKPPSWVGRRSWAVVSLYTHCVLPRCLVASLYKLW